MVTAFYLERPTERFSSDKLDALGVLHFTYDPATEMEKVESLMEERAYTCSDVITISEATLPDYHNKLRKFATEHYHEDEEIRYTLEGGGFFDIRTPVTDDWVRIHCLKGDLLILPKGAFHRFLLDDQQYNKTMRLFKEEVNWTAIERTLAPESKKVVEESEEDEDEVTQGCSCCLKR